VKEGLGYKATSLPCQSVETWFWHPPILLWVRLQSTLQSVATSAEVEVLCFGSVLYFSYDDHYGWKCALDRCCVKVIEIMQRLLIVSQRNFYLILNVKGSWFPGHENLDRNRTEIRGIPKSFSPQGITGMKFSFLFNKKNHKIFNEEIEIYSSWNWLKFVLHATDFMNGQIIVIYGKLHFFLFIWKI